MFQMGFGSEERTLFLSLAPGALTIVVTSGLKIFYPKSIYILFLCTYDILCFCPNLQIHLPKKQNSTKVSEITYHVRFFVWLALGHILTKHPLYVHNLAPLPTSYDMLCEFNVLVANVLKEGLRVAPYRERYYGSTCASLKYLIYWT